MKTRTQFSDIQANDHSGHEITLELVSGPMDGLKLPFMRDTLNIGRDRHQDVSLPLDTMVSRFHAQIMYEGEKWWLQDVGSTNGTFIEKRIIKGKVQLSVGDIFTVGRTEIKRIC